MQYRTDETVHTPHLATRPRQRSTVQRLTKLHTRQGLVKHGRAFEAGTAQVTWRATRTTPCHNTDVEPRPCEALQTYDAVQHAVTCRSTAIQNENNCQDDRQGLESI